VAPAPERVPQLPRSQLAPPPAWPGAIGAIFGAAIPLAGALRETWQFVVLGVAAVALLVARRGIISTLVGAAIVGVVVGLAGGSVPA
jgi:chromate transporter